MTDLLEEILRRVSQLQAENADLQEQISSLHKEIEGLRRANANYQLQFENRLQDDIWNLTKEKADLHSENVRLNELKIGLIAEIDKLTKDREGVRKKRPQWLQTDHPLESKLAAFIFNEF